MLNIFKVLKAYEGKWSVTNTRDFTEEEIATIAHAEVVASEYGNSVKFWDHNGTVFFIPLSNESSLVVGDHFDLKTGKLLTLSKPGEKDIDRVIEG